MQFNNFPPGVAAVAGYGAAVAVAYVAIGESGSNLTQYTFSGFAIGAAAANRVVVVGVAVEGNNNAPGAISGTIGGVTATAPTELQANPDAGTKVLSAIMYAVVPTGTTADVVVDVAAAPSNCAIIVWTMLKDYGPPAAHTAVGTDGTQTSGTQLSMAVECLKNGSVIVNAVAGAATDGTIGGAGFTSDISNGTSSNTEQTGGHGDFTTAGTKYATTASLTNEKAGVAAAFR